MKDYIKAPLPFLGQKRNWLKEIKEIDFSNKIVIDMFGGSGLLSHAIKQSNPTAEVVWNDFDNYQERLDHIGSTNKLRLKLFEVVGNLRSRPSLEDSKKDQAIQIIRDHLSEFGYVDWITISSWLLFSGNYCNDFESLVNKQWYKRVPMSDVSASGYLNGVKREQMDFRKLFDKYKDLDNAVWVCDPPYIATHQGGYFKGLYFKLRDGVELIKLTHDRQSILFSSPKSEIDALFDAYNINITKFDAKKTGDINKSLSEYMYLINM